MSNVLIIPASGIIGFDSSNAGSNSFSSLNAGTQLSYDGGGGLNIKSYTTASSAINRLTIDGTQGRLFSVTDVLTGSLMSVNDIAGLPILEVSDTPSVVMGTFNTKTFILSGTQLGLGLNPVSTTSRLAVSGNVTVVGNISATGNITANNFIGNITGGVTGLASKASTLAQNGGNGAAMTFNWSGQSGQPYWLWGGNDGVNHYVYNPSNFSVSAATNSTCSQCVFSNDGTRNPNNTLPTSSGHSVRYDFAEASRVGNPGSLYAGVMTYAPWTGDTTSTGDNSYQLAFASTARNGGVPALNIRNGLDSTWNQWYGILHTGSLSAIVPGNFCVGTNCSGTTTTPSYISTGQSYSNGTSPASLKYKLYDDGTDTNRYGFTVGPNADVQYHASNAVGSHNFYSNGSTNIATFNSTGLNVNGTVAATGGNSTQWNSAYTNQTRYLPLSGGTVSGAVRINSNLTITGNFSAQGTAYFANTQFTTTSALCAIANSSGPALYIGQSGSGDLASFYDYTPIAGPPVEVLHVGATSGNPYVGIYTSYPNKELTVVGDVSATKNFYDSVGNSSQWNSVYSYVKGVSSNYTNYLPLSGGTVYGKTVFGNNNLTSDSSLGQINALNATTKIVGQSGGNNQSTLAVSTSAGNNLTSNISLWSTFSNFPSDTTVRRTSDIIAGFNNGTWGNEYLTFNVGNNGSSNDGALLTNEKMRITSNSISVCGTLYKSGNINGGVSNTVSGSYNDIINGKNNSVSGNSSSILNGCCNLIDVYSCCSTILNGYGNCITAPSNLNNSYGSSIFNGDLNCIYNSCYSYILAGSSNNVTGNNFGFIGGGIDNFAAGPQSVILTGCVNSVCGSKGTILNGKFNLIDSTFGNGVIGGGAFNKISADNSFIGTGHDNIVGVGSCYSFIGSGQNNNTMGFSGVSIFGNYLSANRIDTTYVNNLSSQGLVYSIGGNSNNWNSVYTTWGGVTNNSTNWNSAYTDTSNAASGNTVSTLVKRNATGNFGACCICVASGGTFCDNTTNTTSGNWSTAYTATNAATNVNTASTIVKRDASGNFCAGIINGTSFCDGTNNNSCWNSAYAATNAATNLNTVSTIVKRDASGNFIANNVSTVSVSTSNIFSVGNEAVISDGYGSNDIGSGANTLSLNFANGVYVGLSGSNVIYALGVPYYYELNGNSSAIGPAIAPFFGGTSNPSDFLAPNARYEIIYELYYQKTTAGTITYTLSADQNMAYGSADYIQSGNTTSYTTVTVSSQMAANTLTSPAKTFALPATQSITTLTYQHAKITAYLKTSTSNINLALAVTNSSTGTITPLGGSYRKITRVY